MNYRQTIEANKSASRLRSYMTKNGISPSPGVYPFRMDDIYFHSWDNRILDYLRSTEPRHYGTSEVTWTGAMYATGSVEWRFNLPNGKEMRFRLCESAYRNHIGYDPHMRAVHKDS